MKRGEPFQRENARKWSTNRLSIARGLSTVKLERKEGYYRGLRKLEARRRQRCRLGREREKKLLTSHGSQGTQKCSWRWGRRRKRGPSEGAMCQLKKVRQPRKKTSLKEKSWRWNDPFRKRKFRISERLTSLQSEALREWKRKSRKAVQPKLRNKRSSPRAALSKAESKVWRR